MTNIPTILFPIWILLAAFIFCLLFWNYHRVQVTIAISSCFLLLLASVGLLLDVLKQGIQVIQLGNWQAPFGITLVADLFSAAMVLISAVVALVISIYASQELSVERKKYGFYPMLLVMMLGVCGSFLTGDVFNLYVWFEVMLVASFVLIVLGNKKSQLEGAVKYVILSFISSGFLLTGIGILYRLTGTLNMADLANAIAQHPRQDLVTISGVFFFMGFGMKAAVFPLFSWLPASYPTPPTAVAALMSGLLTKVGVYALIRFFTLLYTYDLTLTHSFLMIIAGLTMFFGVMGAIAQNDFRKVLSFHIISQIGYMIMGLAIFTPLAIAGAVFYIIHHILVKTNLFLISGIIKETNGYFQLNKLGGVYKMFPFVTLLFIISAFSLAGLPPLSGFWGKFVLAKAGLENGHYLVIGISLLVGFLTLFSMTKIWRAVFWSPVPEELKAEVKFNAYSLLKKKYAMLLSSALLAICTLVLSFYPEFLLSFSKQVANQLLNPQIYIDAVLNK